MIWSVCWNSKHDVFFALVNQQYYILNKPCSRTLVPRSRERKKAKTWGTESFRAMYRYMVYGTLERLSGALQNFPRVRPTYEWLDRPKQTCGRLLRLRFTLCCVEAYLYMARPIIFLAAGIRVVAHTRSRTNVDGAGDSTVTCRVSAYTCGLFSISEEENDHVPHCIQSNLFMFYF